MLEESLYIRTSKVKLPPPPATLLGIWLRHYCSHSSELVPGISREGHGHPHMSDHVIAALTTNPYTRSRFESRLEYVIRHPATGWFWPRLWRGLYAARNTLPSDVLERYYVPLPSLAVVLPSGSIDL
jgi:hypothetical protein